MKYGKMREPSIELKYLENQNQLKKKEQLKSVLNLHREKVCKSNLILNYFGEETTEACGICSYRSY
jgi:ATP-dependent DNA helicase RecQ